MLRESVEGFLMRQASEFNMGVRGPVSEKVDQMERCWTFKACLPPKGGGGWSGISSLGRRRNVLKKEADLGDHFA